MFSAIFPPTHPGPAVIYSTGPQFAEAEAVPLRSGVCNREVCAFEFG